MIERLTRRGVLTGGGLTVAFSILGRSELEAQEGGPQPQGPPPIAPGLPGDLAKYPYLDSWIHLGPDGRVTVFTGKAELGQGIKTALVQLAAAELAVPPGAVSLVTADTARTPDEGVTAGSHSMQASGTAVMNAAANVRLLLLAEASRRWRLPDGETLTVGRGAIAAADGRRILYGDLARDLTLHVAARPNIPRLGGAPGALIGRDLPRIDIPGKLEGRPAYVQDLRPNGMAHARVIRGLSDTQAAAVPKLPLMRQSALGPGVELVQQGRFVAVLASQEWAAITAMRRLAAALPRPAAAATPTDPIAFLEGASAQDVTIFERPGPSPEPAAKTLSARYTRPYLMHGSIGPSCALAIFEGGELTVFTHSQGVSPLRGAIAELVRLDPAKVRCIHVEGAGCYGHNGADDVAADAALIAMQRPGRPIRVQWMREQEHGFEPLGPAMAVRIDGAVDPAGRIVAWRHQVWSNSHNARPVGAGGLLAGGEVDPPFPAPKPKPIPMPEGGGDRNGEPLYSFANASGVYHFVAEAPVRVSALRSLGAHMNVFAIEGFMDELAAAARRDPVAFRLDHLQDPRAREAIAEAAARFGWSGRARLPGRGFGFAFARYKNLGAYCAIALELEVERESGRLRILRVQSAVDSGEAVNPDGVRNQIEGAIVQSLSWTTQESVALGPAGRGSFDWSAYPILRFDQAPMQVDVHVITRPGAPFLGTGEAGQGPMAAAIANGVFDAVSLRIRDMPLSPERVRAGLPA